jgi:undecaprenyl-diphosphatase
MTLAHALLYGFIQGLSEFLPVSSSGHLALLPYLMAFKDPGVVFDLCMHVGTALAVVLYFRKELIVLLKGIPPQAEVAHRNFFLNFAFATFVSVVFILLLKPIAAVGRSPWFIAANQAVFGVVLLFADRYQWRGKHSSPGFFHTHRQWRVAGIIGAAQALAIFPGVSRSGITLTAGFFQKLDRLTASSFSFLLSLPIIAAGVIKEIPEILDAIELGGMAGDVLLVGVASSFVFGLATIHFFMRLIARIGLGWFAAYRLVLAGVLVWLLLTQGAV